MEENMLEQDLQTNEKLSKKEAFSQWRKKFFKSKGFVCILAAFFTILALVVMLHIDFYNDLRIWLYGSRPLLETVVVGGVEKTAQVIRYSAEGVPGLGWCGDTSIFTNMLGWLGLTQYDIMWNTWLFFIIVVVMVWVVVIMSFFASKAEAKYIHKLEKKFKNEKNRHRMFNIIYYSIIIAIAVAIVGILALFGIFENEHNMDIFVNLMVTLLIAIACIIIPVLVISGIIAIIAGAVYLISHAGAKKQEPVLEGAGGGLGKDGIGTLENPLIASADTYPHEEQPLDAELEAKDLFPALSIIDTEEAEKGEQETTQAVDIAPRDFIIRFQAYLCEKHKLYYELPLLRSFIAGMASARILILEGLSGTGKSMLPRMFGEFIGSKTFFCPVQATWRDRTDIVGYYSDFTNEFKETEFLKRLYRSNYYQSEFNLMVLDEMNISRIEYYFADFLSILEYPPEDWLVKLMQVKEGQTLPIKLENGNVRIPINTWFIGTANTDDSTFTITDKVYDRSIIIDFKEKNEPITPQCPGEELHGFKVEQLYKMFENAYKNPNNSLNSEETDKFIQLCNVALELFDVRFGNRIMNQINNFIPVYVELGGTKEEAIDFMFARKVIRKLEGKFDDYIKDGLIKMQKEIRTIYGKAAFTETEKYIKKLLKKFY